MVIVLALPETKQSTPTTRSSNGTMTRTAPETIVCSRHNDGEPFELRKETGFSEGSPSPSSSSSLPRTLIDSDLGNILSKRVMWKAGKGINITKSLKNKNGQSSDTQMQEQFFVCPRRDASFLKCLDMSPAYNIRTIFGIAEDKQNPRIEMDCYKATTGCKQQQGEQQRFRQGPHSDWKRSVPMASGVSDHDENSDDGNRRNKRTRMWWADLRRFQREDQSLGNESLLSTEAGVVHLLRSILTPSHDASPWEGAAEPGATTEGTANDDTKEEPRIASPEIVVLVLNNPSEQLDLWLLQRFRVSDAAPSWFFHGITHVGGLPESPDELFPYSNPSRVKSASVPSPASDATLLIYKKLTPRRLLHATNPSPEPEQTKSETPTTIVQKGCLWMEIEAKEEKHDCLDQEGANDNEIGHPEAANPQYQLVSPPYLDLDEEYPGAGLLAKLFSKEALRIFTEDAVSVPQWTPWPENAHYKVSSFGNEKPWTVFPLCHCFPANKPENFTWLPVTKAFVPRTCRLLEEALRYGDGTKSYLRTALFSQMAPRSVLEEHTGWADLANHVLRLHIPLVVPNTVRTNGDTSNSNTNDDLCGTWVDGCVETHAVGRPLLFDDSKIHRAFNYSDGDRIVLIVDLARPDRLPPGTAKSGHTEELDAFIAQMSAPK